MTRKLYLEAGDLEARACVESVAQGEDGRVRVRVDQTVFHPQGGGQRSDRGFLEGAEVLHVAHGLDGEVDHIVADSQPPAPGMMVDLRVDAAWRGQGARLHTGGHLIAALVEEGFPGLRAISGHHWPGEARVEFEGDPGAAAEEIEAALRLAVGRAVEAGLPVVIVGDPHGSRAIAIAHHPPVGCGGTHLSSTAGLSGMIVERVRCKSGRWRVSYRLD